MPQPDVSGATPGRGSWVSGVLLLAAAAGVFVLDLSTSVLPEFGITVAFLYAPVVLVSTVVARRWLPAVTGSAVVLTALGAALGAVDYLPVSYVLGNRGAAVLAILGVAWFGASVSDSRERLRQANQRLQEATRRAERQSRLLAVASEVGRFGGWSVDVATSRVEWSDEVGVIHDLPRGRAPSLEEVLDLYVEEDRPRIRAAFGACRSDGTPFDEELQLISGNSHGARWVAASGRAQRAPDGTVTVVHGVVQDISAKINAQLEAQSSRRALDVLGETMPFIIWTATPDGSLDYCSEELWRYAGVLTSAVHGAGWLELVHPDDQESASERWRASLATGVPYATTFRLRRRDGAYRWHVVRAEPERGVDGVVVKWWGSAYDVHDMPQRPHA